MNRQKLTGTLVLLSLLLGGCTSGAGGTPSQSPTASATSPSGTPCKVTSAVVDQAAGTEGPIVLTYVSFRPAGDAQAETRLARPFEPRIHWESAPAANEADVFAALAQTEPQLTFEPADNADQVNAQLHGVPVSSFPIVGYAAVTSIRLPLTVGCASGQQWAATLETWSNQDLGVMNCHLQPANTAPEAGRLAYDEYC